MSRTLPPVPPASPRTAPPVSRPSPRLPIAVRPALALVLLALLAGCADRPPAVGFLAKPQHRLQSAAHWQVVADDVAASVSAYLTQQTGNFEPVVLYAMRDGDTLFARNFLNAVATRMVRIGHPVAADPRADVTAVGIDVAIVPHAPGQGKANTLPGPVTLLAGGAGVVNWMVDRFPWGATAGVAGLALDAVLFDLEETDTEMILTVSLERDGFFTFRSSAVYYINGRDLWHYQGLAELDNLRSLNDAPPGSVRYDLAGRPYLQPPGRRAR